MAYGDRDTVQLANYDQVVDEQTFQELTDLALAQFKKLRDGFGSFSRRGGIEKMAPTFDGNSL